MSGDQRNKLAKKIKELGEAAKVSCRNVRRDSNKHCDTSEKDGILTEDECVKGKEQVQGLLKSYEGKVDEAAAAKTKEVMES